jgi:hypothetical protein
MFRDHCFLLSIDKDNLGWEHGEGQKSGANSQTSMARFITRFPVDGPCKNLSICETTMWEFPPCWEELTGGLHRLVGLS